MIIRHVSFADLPPAVAAAGAAAALDRLPSTGSGISDDPTVGRSLLVAFESGLEMPRTNNRSQTGDAELDFFSPSLPALRSRQASQLCGAASSACGRVHFILCIRYLKPALQGDGDNCSRMACRASGRQNRPQGPFGHPATF